PEAYLRGSPPIAPARSVTAAYAVGDARTVAMPAASAAAPAALQKTRIATGHLPLPAPMLSMSGASSAAPTMIADRAPARRASSAMPALAPPQEPVMNTMRIATPVGFL